MSKKSKREFQILDARTTNTELVREFIINFLYGFIGNTVTVMMILKLDSLVFANFILYYGFLSIIVNRARYETNFGKFIFMPLACAIGAFIGYKLAYVLGSLI
jgi:hypothetical protein